MDVPLYQYILFSFTLILVAAFVASSKKAFFALGRSEVPDMVETAQRGALHFLTDRPQRTLLTLLILHQGILVCLVLMTLFVLATPSSRTLGLGVVLVCYLYLGRILPRALVQGKEMAYIRTVAPYLKLLVFAVTPLRVPLEALASVVLRGGGEKESPVIQDKDFKNLMVPETEVEPDQYEREMIQNVMEFRETLVKEVMTPRPDMFCVDVHEDLPTIIREARAGGFSRIPVYEGDRDCIVGILYIKDLLSLMLKGVSEGSLLPRNLLHPALHIPETKRVSELLREFKKQNVHIAMVVDEYGGVEGLVCLEDLLEEIVGEIHDEGDMEVTRWKQLNPQTFRVSPMLAPEEFNELFGTSIESEDYESIGGFVLEQLGHFPKWGETIRWEDLEIVVRRVRGVRIEELLVTRLGHSETAGRDAPPPGE